MGNGATEGANVFRPFFLSPDPRQQIQGCEEFTRRATTLLADEGLRNWKKYLRLMHLTDSYHQALQQAHPGLYEHPINNPTLFDPLLSGMMYPETVVTDFLRVKVRFPIIVSALWFILGGGAFGMTYWKAPPGAIRVRRAGYGFVIGSAITAGLLAWHFLGRTTYRIKNPNLCGGQVRIGLD